MPVKMVPCAGGVQQMGRSVVVHQVGSKAFDGQQDDARTSFLFCLAQSGQGEKRKYQAAEANKK